MNIFKWLKKFNPSSLILMYHRVTDAAIDPWQLSVTAPHFEQQLQVLKESGLVVPISQVVDRLYSGKKTSSSIVITFDDGYADNYEYAKPLLEKYDLPATFFICTDHLGKAKEFWWDELAHLVLLTKELPPRLSFTIKNTLFPFDLRGEQTLTEEINRKHQLWNGYRKPSTRRAQLYMMLWQLLSPLKNQEQECLLLALKEWAGSSNPSRKKSYSMSERQITSLAENNLFSIGVHTVSHPMLSYHSKELQNWEITQSKQILENLTDQKMNIFAYPSGNYNDTTIEILKQRGFKAAFTTDAKTVKLKEDPYCLGRFQINNWGGSEFKQIISAWL